MIGSSLYFWTWFLAFSLEYIYTSDVTYRPSFALTFFIISTSVLLFVIDKSVKLRIKKYIKIDESKIIKNKNEKLLLIFTLIGIAFTASYSNFQFPILKIFNINYIDYNEFGIKGLQGLINACYLSASTILLYRIFFNSVRIKFSKFIVIAIFIYPILLLSRQILFSLLIQIFVIWFLVSNKSKIKLLFTYLSILVFGFFSFWIMGSIRTGDDVITSFIGDGADEKFAILYWPYVYVMSPLSNLALNVENSTPNNDLLTFTSSLIPSPVKDYFHLNIGFVGFDNIELINPNLNMSTFYAPGFLSYGWLGMILYFIILSMVFKFIKSRVDNNFYYFLSYVVMLQILALTFFTNLLFYLPVVVQILIFYYLGFNEFKKISKKS
jgi:oligosaccharide repeat unit polymerase